MNERFKFIIQGTPEQKAALEVRFHFVPEAVFYINFHPRESLEIKTCANA
jgi:hypothetical protein